MPTPRKTTPPPLTDRQSQIMDVIQRAVVERGYPPSVREIGDAVGLKSPSSVHSQMNTLEEMGYIRRDPTHPRAIEVLAGDRTELPLTTPTRPVPVVGQIAAGGPILADQQIEEHLALPESLVGSGTIFALKVRGESMVEAGVMPGDTVVVRQQPAVEQGEMCAALIDGEATVKFFRRAKDGRIWLDPANAAFEPIPVPDDVETAIMGKVVTVLRRL